MHLNNKIRNPNRSDKIEEMEILTGIAQKLRDDQQTITETIKKN